MTTKILLTGATGFVGRQVSAVGGRLGPDRQHAQGLEMGFQGFPGQGHDQVRIGAATHVVKKLLELHIGVG